MFKTPLAFTFPEPIYHINFDRQADPLAKHFKDVEIHTHDIVIPPDDELTVQRCGELLQEFMESYKGALAQDEGTVVVDTVSMLWTLITVYMLKDQARGRIGVAKPSQESRQQDYGDANMTYEQILLAPKVTNLNVVFLVRAQTKFGTEILVPQCQKNTAGFCNLWLRMERDEDTDKFVAIVEGSGFDKDHEGTEIVSPTYEKIMKVLEIGEEGEED